MRYYSAVWCLKFHTNCRSGWGWVVACRRCDALDFFNEKRGKRASPVERGGRAGRLARGATRAAQVCRIRPDPPNAAAGRESTPAGAGGPIDGRRDPLSPRTTALDRINSLLIDNQSIIDRLSIGDWRHLSTQIFDGWRFTSNTMLHHDASSFSRNFKI